MLNQLLEIVKQNAGDAIIQNPEVPNAKNDQAIKVAASSLLNNLKGQAGGGNLNAVLDIFKSGSTASSNPLVNNITKNVAGELAKKLGISQAAATGIVNQLVPIVMSQLAKKTNDPNDKSIDLQTIAKALSGKGDAGGILGALGGLLGKR